MKIGKFLILILVSLASIPIFLWLENGFSVKTPVDLVKPIIFSLALFLSLGDMYKKILLIVTLFLLFLMVVFYLFWKIDLSNWFGSLGFGMLIIYTLGYFPELLKRGFVEKS